MFIADPLPITIRSYSFIRVEATSKQISVWRLALGSPIDWDGRATAHSYEETRQALLGVKEMEELLNLALNLMGTFAFGLSGGILAVRKQMDLFGVLLRYSKVVHHGRFITGFDAVGLSIFTVTGTTIALNAGLSPAPAALLGMLTGVGGGVLRDIMAAEVPLIFRSEIYAVASLLGAIIIIIATQIGFSGVPAEILAAIATFTLRMVSLRRGWRIPIAMPKSTDKG